MIDDCIQGSPRCLIFREGFRLQLYHRASVSRKCCSYSTRESFCGLRRTTPGDIPFGRTIDDEGFISLAYNLDYVELAKNVQ